MTLLAAVLVVNGLSLVGYYFNPRYAREDARNAARYLQSATGPQDLILVVGNPMALRYYYKGNVPIVTWSKKENGDQIVITERLKELTTNHERLWLVEIRDWEKDPTGTVKGTLERLYNIVQEQHLPGVEIYAYDL